MVIRISNSEGLAYGSCETKWMFAHHPEFKLEPKYQSLALTRGLVGHEVLEVFFKAIKKEIPVDEAKILANKRLIEILTEAMISDIPNKIVACNELIPIINEYFSSALLFEFLDSIEILGVEIGFEIPLYDGMILPGRIDLLVRYTKGRYKGEVVVVDNKFVYNFWSEDDFKMNSQIPTYIKGARILHPDAVIRRGMINQLRHRSNAQERFTLTPLTPTAFEIKAIIGNHIRLSEKIEKALATPGKQLRVEATKTLSKYSCGNCGFKLLCKSEITDGNTKDLAIMHYQPNSYGYNGEEEEEEEEIE